MRVALVVCLAVAVTACSGNPTSPSNSSPGTSSAGTTTNIAGSWSGTIASSNNPTLPFAMTITQSGSSVSGTWYSDYVSWLGQISGSTHGSTFSGELTFSGIANDGTVCNGTASVAGSANTIKMSWTSSSGVVGPSCPAPLPVDIKIDVQKQN